jgi:hypothetical protein
MSVGSVAVQLQYGLYVGHLSKLAFHFMFKVVRLVVVVSSIRLACNGSRMSRRLGFWKSIVSYVTKITKKSNRPNFHPNPIFGYAMLAVGTPLLQWKRENPTNQKSESIIWTVQKIQFEQFFIQKYLKINKVEVQKSRRGEKVFVLNSVQSILDAKFRTFPEVGSSN